MANSSTDLYNDPIDDLSQGDVVEISPHAYLDPPLRQVRLSSSGAITVKEAPINTLPSHSEIVAQCSPSKALILNYDCEISKPTVLRLVI